MRNHAQSWIAKIILGGIALSFGLWGVGSYFSGSRVQNVAEVDGNAIPDSTFYRAYERQLNSYRALLGKKFSKKAMERMGVKQDTLQTLINRRLMLDEANRMGLVAPAGVLLARVRSNPAFRSADQFDPERYRIITRNMGYRTPADYEKNLRLNIMINALQRAITDTAVVTDEEVHRRFEQEYEKRVLAALVVDPAGFEKGVHISDKAARDYYDAHKEQYRSPLRLDMDAVVIDPAILARDMEIDASDLKAAYQNRQGQFAVPETRHVRQIVVRVAPNAGQKAVEQARKRAEQVLQRIRKGADFAKVAREVSEGAAAKSGGDLGFVAQGTMVSALDKVAFSLKKGGISDPITTRFGYHIIQVEDIRPAREKSFAEVRDTLAKQLRMEKADDEAYKLSQDLDDALGREDSLKAAADSLNMKVRRIGPISRNEAQDDPLLGPNAELRKQVFSAHPDDPVEVTELSHGRFAAVAVTKRMEPQTLSFAKVARQVHADALHAAATRKAKAEAKRILSGAAKSSLATLAQKHGQPIYISKPVKRSGAGDDATWLTTEVLDAAFTLPKGAAVGHVIEVPKGFAVVRVRDVIAASPDEFAKQEKGIRAMLTRSDGAVRFARWMASVRARHEIVIHPDVLARF
ncbi:MAG TPA: SurA N-terminal domain-containing protein [Mariprofundaceae bacterium]|nr:SurA N-terminal domain-containing protein [Mariprofundaceae bacterium]